MTKQHTNGVASPDFVQRGKLLAAEYALRCERYAFAKHGIFDEDRERFPPTLEACVEARDKLTAHLAGAVPAQGTSKEDQRG